MGVLGQLGVSKTGEFIKKVRITHDLSFPAAISNQSVNSRVNEDELEPCMFGKALQRSIHHIVILRQRHPDKRIWLRKEDFKSAYRRMHLRARTAKRTGVKIVIDGITYILIYIYFAVCSEGGPQLFAVGFWVAQYYGCRAQRL